MDDKNKQPATNRLERPRQIDELSPDQLVAVVLRLTMEISALRERLATNEQLLQQAGIFADNAIDDFKIDAQEKSRRDAERFRLIDNVINDLR
jgi:predicted  nucleic acid-binding Zn-ribbon protein